MFGQRGADGSARNVVSPSSTNSYQQNTQTPKFEEYCKVTDETALDGDNFEEKRKKKAKVKNTKFMGVDSNMDGCMLSSLSVKNRPSEPHANRSSHF